MEAIIIILLVILAGFSFAIWKDGRSKDKEQPAEVKPEVVKPAEKIVVVENTDDLKAED